MFLSLLFFEFVKLGINILVEFTRETLLAWEFLCAKLLNYLFNDFPFLIVGFRYSFSF